MTSQSDGIIATETEPYFTNEDCDHIAARALINIPATYRATLGNWLHWEVRAMLEAAIELEYVLRP